MKFSSIFNALRCSIRINWVKFRVTCRFNVCLGLHIKCYFCSRCVIWFSISFTKSLIFLIFISSSFRLYSSMRTIRMLYTFYLVLSCTLTVKKEGKNKNWVSFYFDIDCWSNKKTKTLLVTSCYWTNCAPNNTWIALFDLSMSYNKKFIFLLCFSF